MSAQTHTAQIGLFNVDPVGNIVDKNGPNTTIKQVLQTQQSHLVIVDSAIPNTAGNPTVKAYIEAEAANDYVVCRMSQTEITTYHKSVAGG
jgi:hypothetical protein